MNMGLRQNALIYGKMWDEFLNMSPVKTLSCMSEYVGNPEYFTQVCGSRPKRFHMRHKVAVILNILREDLSLQAILNLYRSLYQRSSAPQTLPADVRLFNETIGLPIHPVTNLIRGQYGL